MQKPYENIFNEFYGEQYDDDVALGDVKYHLGYSNSIKTDTGKSVYLNLVPNPSHLETVTPVVLGLSRSRIDQVYGNDYGKLAPIVIHGDAAVASQGVVYESIQMSQLRGYKTGGTIHIVINNQVGFTTNYRDARSSTYCTDIAKVIKAPIFHVNGDEPEALVHTISLALEYRQKFHTDVFIDLKCYRRHGHNEGDEPGLHNPCSTISSKKHPNVRDIYSQRLIRQGVLNETEVKQAIKLNFDKFAGKEIRDSPIAQKSKYSVSWKTNGRASGFPLLRISNNQREQVWTSNRWNELPGESTSSPQTSNFSVLEKLSGIARRWCNRVVLIGHGRTIGLRNTD